MGMGTPEVEVGGGLDGAGGSYVGMGAPQIEGRGV